MKNPSTEQIILLKKTINSKYNDPNTGSLVFQLVNSMLFISQELDEFDFTNQKTLLQSVNHALNTNKMLAFKIILHFWKKYKKEITSKEISDDEMKSAFDNYFETNPIFGERLLIKQAKTWKKMLKDIIALIGKVSKVKEEDEVNLEKLKAIMSTKEEQLVSNDVKLLSSDEIPNNKVLENAEYCSKIEKEVLGEQDETLKREGKSCSIDWIKKCAQLEIAAELSIRENVLLKEKIIFNEMIHAKQTASMSGKIASLEKEIEELRNSFQTLIENSLKALQKR